MISNLPLVGIDIRLIGQERTGDEVVFLNLTRALLQEGRGQFSFRLLTHESNPQKLEGLRIKLECVGRKDVVVVSLPQGKNRFVWNMLVLPWELSCHPVDIYHTQYIAPLVLPRKTKLVTHIHDVSFAAYPKWIALRDRFFLSLLIPRSLRRSDVIIAPSQFTRLEIERYYPYASGKIAVVSNAVAKDWLVPVAERDMDAIRQMFQLPKHYIIASGTMQPRKNIPLLIQAWVERPEELREVGLVLTGNRFGYHVDIRLSDEAINKRIIFPGYVDVPTLRALVAGAHVFAFPSLYEGFGIPLLEAFASDTPVLASRIPPFEEVGGDAFLAFDPTSLAEMKKTLYSLLVEKDVAQQLIQAGKERLQLFSWEKSAKNLLTIYRTLLP